MQQMQSPRLVAVGPMAPEMANAALLQGHYPFVGAQQMQQMFQGQGMVYPPPGMQMNGKGTGTRSGVCASRHMAAEQRRRARINERLEALRSLVPHSARANTAAFLEEVYEYIGALHKQLERLGGGPFATPGPSPPTAMLEPPKDRIAAAQALAGAKRARSAAEDNDMQGASQAMEEKNGFPSYIQAALNSSSLPGSPLFGGVPSPMSSPMTSAVTSAMAIPELSLRSMMTEGLRPGAPPQQQFAPSQQSLALPQQQFANQHPQAPAQQQYAPNQQSLAPSQQQFAPNQHSQAPPQQPFAQSQQSLAPPQQQFAPNQHSQALPQQQFSSNQHPQAPPQQQFAPPQQSPAPSQQQFAQMQHLQAPPQQAFAPNQHSLAPPPQQFAPSQHPLAPPQQQAFGPGQIHQVQAPRGPGNGFGSELVANGAQRTASPPVQEQGPVSPVEENKGVAPGPSEEIIENNPELLSSPQQERELSADFDGGDGAGTSQEDAALDGDNAAPRKRAKKSGPTVEMCGMKARNVQGVHRPIPMKPQT